MNEREHRETTNIEKETDDIEEKNERNEQK